MAACCKSARALPTGERTDQTKRHGFTPRGIDIIMLLCGDSLTDPVYRAEDALKAHLDAAFFEKRTCVLAGHDER